MKKEVKSFSSLLNVAMIVFFMFSMSGCNLPGTTPTEITTGETILSDENAQTYRMFFDSASDLDGSNVQVRKFVGQIHIVDLEKLFGDLNSLPKDENGNYSAIKLDKGTLFVITITPDFKGVNLMSSDTDGTASSVFDLDGDGIVDVADIRFGNGGWMYLVTDPRGLDLFKDWVNGLDPTCQPGTSSGQPDQASSHEESGIPNFCSGGDSSSGSGSSGGSNDLGNNGIIDPMDILCAGYPTGNQAALNSRIRGFARVENTVWEIQVQFGEDETYSGDTRIVTGVERNDNGDIIQVQKHIYYYDRDGNLLQETHETVGPDGEGTRKVTKHFADGTTSHSETPISTNLGDDGDYDETIPERSAPEHTEGAPNVDEPTGGSGNSGSQPNPGPEGDDSRVAEFCANRGTTRGGAEEAAGNDPTSISVGCGDLVDAPSNGDCTIIEWAKPDDFAGALDRSGGDGCGELYEDAGGHCEPTSTIEKLRGKTAEILSMQLGDVAICGGLVCRPPDVSIENQQAVSLSYHGTATDTVLCYQGPGDGYPIISSVRKETQVEILGIGVEKGWLVIDSPVFSGFPCWVSETVVVPDDGFDASTLPMIPIPTDRITVPDAGGNGSGGDSGGSNDGGGGGGNQGCGPDEYFSIITKSCEPFG